MAPKKDSSNPTPQSAAGVSVDLGMTDAALGATIRGILGKLAATEVVTVVPERGHKSGKHRRGVKTFGAKGQMLDVTKADVQGAPHPRNLQLGDLVVHGPKMAKKQGKPRGVKGPTHSTDGVKITEPVSHFRVAVKQMQQAGEVLSALQPADSGNDVLDRAILAAEKRGSTAAAALLASDEMLSTTEVAKRVGISRQAVAKRRDSGTILALKAGPKSLKYPDWQILPTGEVVPGIEEVLRRLDGDTWTAYRFLKEIAPDGTDRPLYGLLREGDVDTVLAHIEGVLGGAGS